VVTSNLPLLKTEDAQVGTTLSTAQLTDLPSVDPANGWTSLLKLLPGATSTPGGTNGGGSGDLNPGVDQAIAGSMPYFSSFLVDGGSIWLPHSANIDQGESETVAEVNVITSTASALYGGGGNVFNVISKSGTNQYHGALYDYFQNDALDARDYQRVFALQSRALHIEQDGRLFYIKAVRFHCQNIVNTHSRHITTQHLISVRFSRMHVLVFCRCLSGSF
jgi:hypothetical protein